MEEIIEFSPGMIPLLEKIKLRNEVIYHFQTDVIYEHQTTIIPYNRIIKFKHSNIEEVTETMIQAGTTLLEINKDVIEGGIKAQLDFSTTEGKEHKVKFNDIVLEANEPPFDFVKKIIINSIYY